MAAVTMITMPDRLRALLLLNGVGLLLFSVFVGWQWFVALLGQLVVWPILPPVAVDMPGDARAWRMVHMEAISNGLLLMAWGLGGAFIRLTPQWHRVFFWSALTTAWLFTVPAYFNAIFGTRGLAMGGGPFKGGLANDIIFLFGWPPLIAVHITLILALIGLVRTVKALPRV
jgi:hypothetical protein